MAYPARLNLFGTVFFAFLALLAPILGATPTLPLADAPLAGRLALRAGDVVAFVGGETTVQESETAHLESLLSAAVAGRGVQFRNLGWEGDTVFEQPRDVNFPTLLHQLQRVKATVIILQFGRAESFGGQAELAAFKAAYGTLCGTLAQQTPRLVFVTPPPFEKPNDPLVPDLSARNADLQRYAAEIRTLAEQRHCLCIDLFAALSEPAQALTDNGQHFTPRGMAFIALAAARQLKLEAIADRAGAPSAGGTWSEPSFEALRQAIVAKNQLWFDYCRPMNWAFLGGDRAQVASSYDHRDPSVRWFPAEMEQFVPLIEQAEARINELAKLLKAGTP